MRRNYIGLACTVHDPALAIVSSEGEILFAEASERYLQTKRAFFQPPDDLVRIKALIDTYCDKDAELVLAHSWLERKWKNVLARLYYTAFGDKISPLLKPTMIGQTNAYEQVGLNLEYRLFEAGQTRPLIRRYYDHHLNHAAAAAYGSPFSEAVCAIIDGHGEKGPESFFHYTQGKLIPLQQAHRRQFRRNASLGVYYAGLCMACGFDPMKGEEWKVMGLAPYGKKDEQIYAKLKPMMTVEGLNVLGDNVEILDVFKTLRPKTKRPAIESADLAFTGQLVFNETSRALLRNLQALNLSDNLVLSGGCALNSSWNGKIIDETGFKNLHVNSAPADDGNAVGAALLAFHEDNPNPKPPKRHSAYLGERISPQAIGTLTEFGGLKNALPPGVSVTQRAAELLAEGKILGWVQGRAEFGPRALGNRSILADPRSPAIKEIINARVKFREEFRPFAPSILHEHGPEYFEHYQESPYMERALKIRPEVFDKVPGVVHVDGTGRLQSVTREGNLRYYELISAFHRLTGVPLVLNTSFNVMGKPIIHTVEDAVAVFFTSGLDALVIEDSLFLKS
jgi:carbamoyltransferase